MAYDNLQSRIESLELTAWRVVVGIHPEQWSPIPVVIELLSKVNWLG